MRSFILSSPLLKLTFYCAVAIIEIVISVVSSLFYSHLFSFSIIKLSWSLLVVALGILALRTNVSTLLNVVRVITSVRLK